MATDLRADVFLTEAVTGEASIKGVTFLPGADFEEMTYLATGLALTGTLTLTSGSASATAVRAFLPAAVFFGVTDFSFLELAATFLGTVAFLAGILVVEAFLTEAALEEGADLVLSEYPIFNLISIKIQSINSKYLI